MHLIGAKEKLHLFQANLLEEGAFDPVIDGCEGVFHVASPVSISANDPQVNLFPTITSFNLLQSSHCSITISLGPFVSGYLSYNTVNKIIIFFLASKSLDSIVLCQPSS